MHSLVQKLVPFLVCCKITEAWAVTPDFTCTDLCGQKNKTCIHTLCYKCCAVNVILYCTSIKHKSVKYSRAICVMQTVKIKLVNIFTYLLTPWSRVLLEKPPGLAANQEIPHIESESSSPYSQVPATHPYPEPTPSSPHHPFPLPEDPS